MLLNCHSYYSLRYGTLAPADLVAEAARLGHTCMVLTDINNTSCSFEFLEACKKQNIRGLLGIEFRDTDHRYLYTGIAKNAEGWRELCSLLTTSSLSGEPLPALAPPLEHSYIIYRSLPKSIDDFAAYEYYGISPREMGSMYSSPVKNTPGKLVAFATVNHLHREGHRIHKLLRCIDKNIVHTKLEAADITPETDYLLSPDDLRQAYALYPGLLRHTEALLASCEISLESGFEKVNKRTFTNSVAGDYDLLCKLAREGCRRRYSNSHRQANERTEKELQVIFKLGFAAYFLITWDIVRYARSAGYHHVGRGSGANSIVAYNLGITDVDPLELDLYFERFINPHRTSPPDFDIDFSWSERDDVTDYIFKRHGKDHTALLATYNTFKGRSIIRELGKVFGLPKNDIDIMVEEPLASDKHHPWARHIFRYGKLIEAFPNYLSIHAGGILISERPLHYHTALQLMPKGFPITHFDMYGAEDLGFHKYDVLSQRGLGHIKDAVDLVKRNKRQSVDVHDITRLKEDP
ncbi:MAG: PHP domain-containing protein, partial [Saprospiraceae bacterium]